MYFAYANGKYFEHPTRVEVLEHLEVAALTAERYADSSAKLKTDPEFQFLWEVIFHGLEDLNSGFGSPSLPRFTPDDFANVIERCAQHHVSIIGIEVFDISSWPICLIDVCGGQHARRLVKSYSNRPGISFSAVFDVGENVPHHQKRDRSRDLIDLEEALGGKRSQDNGDGPGSLGSPKVSLHPYIMVR